MEITISSRLLYKGRNFNFKTDVVQLPNNRRTIRDLVDHPGAVAILPLLPDGRIVLVRQYRYAVQKELLEIPAGTLEKGEEPLDCARRELKEETGFKAGKIVKLMCCYTAPGYSNEQIHFYKATQLLKVNKKTALNEFINVEIVNLDDVFKMIKKNVITDAKTIAGVLTYFTQNKLLR